MQTYVHDLKVEDLQRLFTRDTREAYEFPRDTSIPGSSKACRGTGARRCSCACSSRRSR